MKSYLQKENPGDAEDYIFRLFFRLTDPEAVTTFLLSRSATIHIRKTNGMPAAHIRTFILICALSKYREAED